MISPETSKFIAENLTYVIPDWSYLAAVLGGILIFLSDGSGPSSRRRRRA